MDVRRAEFAGSWYPGSASDCRSLIEEFISAGEPCPDYSGEPLGGIVPHAGWVFSGRIACNVIRCLKEGGAPDTCVVFGRHLHPGSENFIMTRGAWSTPLGEIPIDGELADKLTKAFPFTVETAARHDPDNTIELQLPFIKYFFPQAKMVPLGLPPRADSLEIAREAVRASKNLNRRILLIGSTDLTHYGYNYGFVPKGVGEEALRWVQDVNDRKAVDAMLNLDEEAVIRESLENHNACCGGAAAAAIAGARELGADRGEEIAYGTSYDVRPDSSFVGYAGIVFHG